MSYSNEKLVSVGRGALGRFLQMSVGRQTVLVFIVAAVTYLGSATYDEQVSIDVGMAALPAWNLAHDGTLDIRAHMAALKGTLAHTQVVEVDGRVYSNRAPGTIFIATPAYLLQALFAPSDSFSMWGAAVTAALIAAATVAVMYLVFRRILSPSVALAATALLGLGTGLWSVSADALWSHGPAQLGIAVSLWSLAQGKHAVAGAGMALSLLARPPVGFAAAAVGLREAWQRRAPSIAVALGSTTAVGLVLYLIYGRAILGTWNPLGGYAGHVAIDSPTGAYSPGQVAGALVLAFVDPLRGLLWYAAPLLVLLPGIVSGWRAAPQWVRSAGLGSGVMLISQYVLHPTMGGNYFFAYRYPLEALVFVAPLLAVTWKSYICPVARRRRLFGVSAALTFGLHFYGAVIEPHKWGYW